ncbi:MAG: cytochrome ubiquinol oxidase subunit I [Candidatus Micrarchaeaceae archaeon]|jgi:cytochrome bd ubiquinol oxidase subunit I
MLFIVLFDRFLMAFALAIHIVLASIGMALPVIILIAEYLSIKKNDNDYKILAKRLSIIFIVLFAIGTASGILVAINILVLWPKFMALVSQVAILPFYIETFAFFLEAIFIAIYFYSWDSFKGKYTHLIAGIPIAIGAALSAVLITMINAFMNTPNGFNISNYLKTGIITNVQPWAVFFTPSTWTEIFHVLSSSYTAGSLIFAALFGYMLLRSRDENKSRYYKKALTLFLMVGLIATFFSVISGLQSLKQLVTIQPEKYAAIEGNIQSQSHAPERIGGFPVNGTLKYFIPIPNLQSILATGSANGTVPGLASYNESTWPPLIVHPMFDFMFFMAILLGLILIIWFVLQLLKKNPLSNKLMLKAIIFAGILSVLILEDGWVLAELGRQPWIIYNVMTVSQAANYSPSILPVGFAILAFYVLVIPVTVLAIRKLLKERPLENELVNQ